MLLSTRLFRKNADGAVAIEFAIVAPVLFLIMFGIIEIGLLMLSMSTIESATNLVTRTARLGPRNGVSNAQLQDLIRDEIRIKSAGLVDADKVMISTEFSGNPQTKWDTCNVKVVNGQCNPSTEIVEGDGNPAVFTPPPITPGISEDIVTYYVYYPYTTLTPIGYLFGNNGVFNITSIAVVQNE